MNSAEQRNKWDRCWAESPQMTPTYFSPGEYAKLDDLRAELYAKYLDGIRELSEFGCGLGHNLVPLVGKIRRLRGFDWAESAVRTVRSLGMEADVFDMLDPPRDVKVSGAVLTVHALEQLGESWELFLLFILKNMPQVCIHIEPLVELYDASERDQARRAYHLKRGYLFNFLPEIQKMARHGMAEILELRKSPFGGANHDAYSVLVWRPL